MAINLQQSSSCTFSCRLELRAKRYIYAYLFQEIGLLSLHLKLRLGPSYSRRASRRLPLEATYRKQSKMLVPFPLPLKKAPFMGGFDVYGSRERSRKPSANCQNEYHLGTNTTTIACRDFAMTGAAKDAVTKGSVP